MRRKTLWIVIIVIILLIGIIYAYDVGGIKTIIMQKSSGSVKSTSSYCKDYIIPDKITFRESYPTEKDGSFSKIKSSWKDGTEIVVPKWEIAHLTPACEKGKSLGENVNNYYCKGLRYSKIDINKEGKIGETIVLDIDLVLDSNYQTQETGAEGSQAPYVVNTNFIFEIVDYTCKRNT